MKGGCERFPPLTNEPVLHQLLVLPRRCVNVRRKLLVRETFFFPFSFLFVFFSFFSIQELEYLILERNHLFRVGAQSVNVQHETRLQMKTAAAIKYFKKKTSKSKNLAQCFLTASSD